MSSVDWEGMRPPTWPEPTPPVSDAPSWAPITAPTAVVPPPPPPAPPPPAYPPPSMGGGKGRGWRAVAAALVAVALLGGGFAFARSTEGTQTSTLAQGQVATGSGSTKIVDPNTEEPIAAVAAA